MDTMLTGVTGQPNIHAEFKPECMYVFENHGQKVPKVVLCNLSYMAWLFHWNRWNSISNPHWHDTLCKFSKLLMYESHPFCHHLHPSYLLKLQKGALSHEKCVKTRCTKRIKRTIFVMFNITLQCNAKTIKLIAYV